MNIILIYVDRLGRCFFYSLIIHWMVLVYFNFKATLYKYFCGVFYCFFLYFYHQHFYFLQVNNFFKLQLRYYTNLLGLHIFANLFFINKLRIIYYFFYNFENESNLFMDPIWVVLHFKFLGVTFYLFFHKYIFTPR